MSISISLRAWHPSLGAHEIERMIGWRAHFANSVGEQRVSPSGAFLSGTYRQTYCCFDLPSHDGDHLADALQQHLPMLRPLEDALNTIRRSGGVVELYLFLRKTDSDLGRGFQIEPELLQALSSLGLRLAVEIPD
jgi:hypothetical protein